VQLVLSVWLLRVGRADIERIDPGRQVRHALELRILPAARSTRGFDVAELPGVHVTPPQAGSVGLPSGPRPESRSSSDAARSRSACLSKDRKSGPVPATTRSAALGALKVITRPDETRRSSPSPTATPCGTSR